MTSNHGGHVKYWEVATLEKKVSHMLLVLLSDHIREIYTIIFKNFRLYIFRPYFINSCEGVQKAL